MASVTRVCSSLLSRTLAVRSSTNSAYVSNSCPATLLISSRNYGSKKTKKHSSSSSSSSSDSSDDDKRRKSSKKKVGQSEFWLRKMRTHHVAMDVNKDGVVSWDDFEDMIRRFKATGILTGDELTSLENALKHVWEEEWGASGDPYAFINQEQFLANMENVINNKHLRKKVAKPLPYFFQAVDNDGSGEISVDEFKLYFKCLGLSDEAAMASFSAIDINSDGRLSKKEFVKLGREFFLSEDEGHPSKLFFGPLV